MQACGSPKISIVMPVLNRETTVEKALLSILNQNYENLELIVIDGGSTDKTVEILRRYEKHFSYWHSKKDNSPTLAVNLGIQKATGDLVALCMADDWYEVNTFRKIAETFKLHPDSDMFTCSGRIVSYDEVTQSYHTQLTYTSPKELALNFYNICFAVSAICCRFIKKSFYEKIGLYQLFDDQGRHIFSNDKEFLFRALLNKAKDVFVDYLGHTYLASKESATFGNHQENILRTCHEHMEIAEKYLKLNLPKKYHYFLMYWYNDQSVRLVLYHLLEHRFSHALEIAKTAIKKYPFLWPVIFTYVSMRISSRRLWRFSRNSLKKIAFEK